MIRRLIEADLHRHARRPDARRVALWLAESRTPELLVALCRSHAAAARRASRTRPALTAALAGDVPAVSAALRSEEEAARREDREYWAPLRAELSLWRQGRRR